MAAPAEGAPCWADATFADIEGAKDFYAELLGWSYGESAAEYGGYTQAYVDGKAVAALSPPMPGQEDTRSAWCLYLASPDAEAAAARVRGHDGVVVVEPMRVGEFGTMVFAREPSGAEFGIWQPEQHTGFQLVGAPGAYCWAEVFTRDPAAVDTFFTGVFGYRVRRMPGEMDMVVYDTGGDPLLGRMTMTDDFPAAVPSYVNLYFAVPDCDAAVATVTGRGGAVHYGPVDSPFGRFAAVHDPQGAAFTVVDLTRTTGETPTLVEA